MSQQANGKRQKFHRRNEARIVRMSRRVRERTKNYAIREIYPVLGMSRQAEKSENQTHQAKCLKQRL